MPTRGRQDWASQALDCFLAQDYPNKELIVLDDIEDRSFPYGILNESVTYLLHIPRWTIAEKRNACVEASNGEIILHFDSDDWSSPDRISDQVQRLEESGKAVTGYHTMPFFNEETKKAHVYIGHPLYAVGTSLCFTKAFWEKNRFAESKHQREDNGFVFAARNAHQITTVECGQKMVARIHSNNSVPKHATDNSRNWKVLPVEDLAPGFMECKPVS